MSSNINKRQLMLSQKINKLKNKIKYKMILENYG